MPASAGKKAAPSKRKPSRPTKAVLAKATDDAIRKEYERRFGQDVPQDGKWDEADFVTTGHLVNTEQEPSEEPEEEKIRRLWAEDEIASQAAPPWEDTIEEEQTVIRRQPDVDQLVGARSLEEARPGFTTQFQSEPTQSYCVRNLTGMQTGFRLTRQRDSGSKRTDLKPRGQRGDIQPLLPEDLNDVELQHQVDRGVVEVITAAEARKIISKQVTNAQQAIHPAMAMLRNELGQAGPDGQGMGVVVDNPDERSVVVAQLQPHPGSESTGDVVIAGGPRGGIQRQLPPQQRAIGGNPHIISDGFHPDQAAIQQDAIARLKGVEGPKAGGITNVEVAPAQKG